MKKEDGEPAFPRKRSQHMSMDGTGKIEDQPQNGMTLRDWFAGQAISGMLSNIDLIKGFTKAGGEKGLTGIETLTASAYVYADAMIKERSER